MDAATLVAVLGFAGTVLAALIAGIVALIVNRTEKKRTAENTLEKVYEQRVILRDEQIADLQVELKEACETIRKLRRECQDEH